MWPCVGLMGGFSLWRRNDWAWNQSRSGAFAVSKCASGCWTGRAVLLEVGAGEWDSSIYFAISLQGWFNAYDYSGPDFADDPQVRAAARAVLDFYATSIALKNRQFQMSGAETRTVRNFHGFSTGTAILAWLWFSEDSTTPPGNWNGTGVGEVIYAWASGYRPDPAIVALARRSDKALPADYFNTKPDYLLKNPAQTKEVLHIAENFTLGSANIATGRFGNGNWQFTLWKLLADYSSGNPQLLWGNGGFHGYQGNAPDPWMQIVQYRNTLLQLHRVPANADALVAEVGEAYDEWISRWYTDFLQRFPDPNWGGFRGGQYRGKSVPHNFMAGNTQRALDAYLLFAPGVTLSRHDNWFVLDFENVWVGLASLRPEIVASVNPDSGQITVTGEPETVFGWLVHVVDKSEFKTAPDFVRFLREYISWDWDSAQSDRLHMRSPDGKNIEVTYTVAGSWHEPSYDFDFGVSEKGGVSTFFQHPWRQPSWPSGYGHGRMPRWSVDGDCYASRSWLVFDGPGVTLENGVLRVQAGGFSYVSQAPAQEWQPQHAERLRRMLNRFRVRRALQ
ncbi:MAG: hypothetical protein LR015_08680 [Verrucomicrobia bacterium]|nr:hypothetical protein [Verrucomicrobiota bacterium]